MSLPAALFQRPQVRLAGTVDQDMLQSFLSQTDRATDASGPIVLELTTSGGEADLGRRIAADIRMSIASGREWLFLGKTAVFSAGVTIMSGFPRSQRYLSPDAQLLIHERRLKKDLKLDGALRSVEGVIRDVLAEINNGQLLEREGFEALVAGSDLGIDALYEHVLRENWYLSAADALSRKLIAGIV